MHSDLSGPQTPSKPPKFLKNTKKLVKYVSIYDYFKNFYKIIKKLVKRCQNYYKT